MAIRIQNLRAQLGRAEHEQRVAQRAYSAWVRVLNALPVDEQFSVFLEGRSLEAELEYWSELVWSLKQELLDELLERYDRAMPTERLYSAHGGITAAKD